MFVSENLCEVVLRNKRRNNSAISWFTANILQRPVKKALSSCLGIITSAMTDLWFSPTVSKRPENNSHSPLGRKNGCHSYLSLVKFLEMLMATLENVWNNIPIWEVSVFGVSGELNGSRFETRSNLRDLRGKSYPGGLAWLDSFSCFGHNIFL